MINDKLFFSLVKERRSIRKYIRKAVEIDKIEKLIGYAVWAPSSCNRQSTFFIVVDQEHLKEQISKAAFDQRQIIDAPLTIVVTVDLSKYNDLKNNYAPYLDAGVAIQNILLGAHSMGLACCPIAGNLKEDLIKNILHIESHFLVLGLIAIGYPDKKDIVNHPERKPLKAAYSFNYYNSDLKRGYKRIIENRCRWSRAGWDVSIHYKRPIEGIGFYNYARWKLQKMINNTNGKILLTFSAFGYLLEALNGDRVDCLVTSEDERWFIKNFRKIDASLLLLSPLNLRLLSDTYKYIISFFDIHFMSDIELKVFLKKALDILNDDGEIIIVFINSSSLFGLNYRLANLFKRNIGFLREIGYEVPLRIKDILKLIPAKAKIINLTTSMFIPPLNIGYLFKKNKFFTRKFLRIFDFLQSVPYIKGLGNIAFLHLGKKC